MPTINSANIPFVAAGDLLDRLLTDNTLLVRWLQPGEPVYYEIFNRPAADIVVRQLIIAKAVDRINSNIGYLTQFPFITQPLVLNGSTVGNVPLRIFWDMHVSVPEGWVNIRLARIDRIGGTNNSGGEGDSGTLRFIFTANQETDGVISSTETSLFYLDYSIDSSLTYQTVFPKPADSTSGLTGFSSMLATNEASTIGGSAVFATQDPTVQDMLDFLSLVAPSSGTASYSIADSVGSGTDSFELQAMTHGTGVLTSSAYNSIVSIESDPLNWLDAFNFPFSLNSTRMSQDGAVVIPSSMFNEFTIVAPANDNPTGTTDGTHYPIWISSINKNGTDFTFNFSTYNTTDTDPDASNPIVFATLVLERNMVGGQIVGIEPATNLQLLTGTSGELDLDTQHFGKGHVVLSRLWDTTGGDIDNFFDSLPESPSGTTTVVFTQASGRIGALGVNRVPKFVPTKGQSQALTGTSSRFAAPIIPSSTNRYVTELDTGLGDPINLDSQSGITYDAAINSIGYSATRIHRLVQLIVDQSQASSDPNYYVDALQPRLRILLGGDPVFGDEWYNGTRFMKWNGSSWIG
jgi:hypothetical protein